MKIQYDLLADSGFAEKTRRCRGAGITGQVHDLPSSQVFPCHGRGGNGCSGHGLCFIHALVKWCMHSSSLIDYKSFVEDFAPFHHVHESHAVTFHAVFNYHIGPHHKRQFHLPHDMELKHQETHVALAWLALMFKPAFGDSVLDRGSPGWYDQVSRS